MLIKELMGQVQEQSVAFQKLHVSEKQQQQQQQLDFQSRRVSFWTNRAWIQTSIILILLRAGLSDSPLPQASWTPLEACSSLDKIPLVFSPLSLTHKAFHPLVHHNLIYPDKSLNTWSISSFNSDLAMLICNMSKFPGAWRSKTWGHYSRCEHWVMWTQYLIKRQQARVTQQSHCSLLPLCANLSS